MKTFAWAVVLTCVAMAGVALAQQSEADRGGSSRGRPRGWLPGGDGRIAAAEDVKAGKALTLNIIVVEVNRPSGQKPAIDLSSAEMIVRQVRELEEKGEASVISRVKLSSLEQLPCSVQVGETRPVAAGRAGSPAGRSPRAEGERPVYSYQMTNVGMVVTATSRVEADESIVAELAIESSRLAPVAKPDTDDAIAQRRTTTLQSRSTVRIPKGRGVIVSAAQSTGDEGSRETLILVSGHVEAVAAAATPEKAAATPAETELRVFTLQHASAEGAAKTLERVFAGQEISIVSEEQTNSLYVRGGAKQLRFVEALLQRMDRGE